MSVERNLSECRGLPGWLFGHAFAPRYSVVERAVGRQNTLVAFISAGKSPVEQDRTYHADVCRRCGAIAERSR